MKKLLLLLSLATASFGDTVKYLGTDEVFQGHRVGPIAATLNGMDITMFCVEFTEYVSINQTWEAIVVPVLPDTTDARAAWLMEQMIAGPPGQIGTYQFAIWNLFYPDAPDTGQSNHYVTQSIGQNPAGNWYRLAKQRRSRLLLPDYDRDAGTIVFCAIGWCAIGRRPVAPVPVVTVWKTCGKEKFKKVAEPLDSPGATR